MISKTVMQQSRTLYWGAGIYIMDGYDLLWGVEKG